jgi:antitoxin CcdA
MPRSSSRSKSPRFVEADTRKKATNLSINAELLRQAKELGINLSQLLEKRLIEAVNEEKRRRWLAENEAAAADYNNRVDSAGVFSDGIRRF